MPNLFNYGTEVILHSGSKSVFKIDCDALSEADIEGFAALIASKFQFCKVVGVPRGGLRLAKALQQYCNRENSEALLVDDVLTTGNSMEQAYQIMVQMGPEIIVGVVLFARGRCPNWITPLFEMGIDPDRSCK